MSHDPSHATYTDGAVVEFYARQAELQETERVLFDAYLKPGLDVLDLGVGGGRTTPRLSAGARRYVGVDYSAAMVEHCRRTFPSLTFDLADAAHMPAYADATFDVVVFSFNGLDSLPTLDLRRSCLRECARVLRPRGVLIVSVHNARYLFFRPVFSGARGVKLVWRLVYALWRSVQLLTVRLPARAFWHGAGYARDPGTHGGLRVYVATPERQCAELRAAGFDVERIEPAPQPGRRSALMTGWYYYACRRAAG